MKNAGQSCDAGKRFIVLDAVRAAFETALTDEMAQYAPGDPTDPATRLRPLASLKARDEIDDQVRRSVAKGAKVLLSGEVPAVPAPSTRPRS